MPFFGGFKPNPRQLVINKAHRLFGREAKVNVTGRRLDASASTQLGLAQGGTYLVECFIAGERIAFAAHRNWRSAYKLLVTEVETSHAHDAGRIEAPAV